MGQGHCQGELRPGCDLRPARAPCAPPSVSQPRQTVLRSPAPRLCLSPPLALPRGLSEHTVLLWLMAGVTGR